MESECSPPAISTPPPKGLTEGNPSKTRHGYASFLSYKVKKPFSCHIYACQQVLFFSLCIFYLSLCRFYRRTSGPARRSTRGQWTAEEVKNLCFLLQLFVYNFASNGVQSVTDTCNKVHPVCVCVFICMISLIRLHITSFSVCLSAFCLDHICNALNQRYRTSGLLHNVRFFTL